METTKIKKQITYHFNKLFDRDKNEFDYDDIDFFTNHLECAGVIGYSIPLRGNSDGMDYWLQCEGYIQTKGRGFTIIFDHEAPKSFGSRQEFADYLIRTEQEFVQLKSKLEKIKL